MSNTLMPFPFSNSIMVCLQRVAERGGCAPSQELHTGFAPGFAVLDPIVLANVLRILKPEHEYGVYSWFVHKDDLSQL